MLLESLTIPLIEKSLKNYFSSSKIFYKPRVQLLYMGSITWMPCVPLNTCTAPVAFAKRRVLHIVFLISLILKKTSEDCIGNI